MNRRYVKVIGVIQMFGELKENNKLLNWRRKANPSRALEKKVFSS
jgi:hypothetical protein